VAFIEIAFLRKDPGLVRGVFGNGGVPARGKKKS